MDIIGIYKIYHFQYTFVFKIAILLNSPVSSKFILMDYLGLFSDRYFIMYK